MSRKRSSPTLIAAALVLALPLTAEGQVLFDGPTDSNNCYPFGCYETGGRYQQAYGAGVFGSALTIGSITFFEDEGGGTEFKAGTYTIRLTTTSKSLSGLSGTFDENLGADVTTVFSGVLSGLVTGSQTIALSTPFAYDPGAGNLLMDVMADDITGGSTSFFDAASGGDMSRVTNNTGSVTGHVGTGYGLVTEFDGTAAASTVPEPLSLLLLGTGLAGVAGARRRRSADA